MRVFVAIDITADVKARLTAFLGPLHALAKLSWSPIENLHITTKFIGEWPEEKLDEVKTALAAIPKRGPIAIQVRGLGWFPNDAHPRVFWAGVSGDHSLRALAHATEDALANLGVKREEREFSPHLTLARIRQTVPLSALNVSLSALRTALENVAADFGSFRASSFYLYLSRAGKYTKLAEFPLE